MKPEEVDKAVVAEEAISHAVGEELEAPEAVESSNFTDEETNQVSPMRDGTAGCCRGASDRAKQAYALLLLCLITVAFALSIATQTSCAFMRFNLEQNQTTLANKRFPNDVNDPEYVPGQMTFGLWKYDAGFVDSTCQRIYPNSDVTWGGVLKVARTFGIMASIAGGFGLLVLLAEILFDPFTMSRPVVACCVGLAGILQVFTFLYYFADVCWGWNQIDWICESEQGTWFSIYATLFFLLGALISILLSKEPPLISSKTKSMKNDASLANIE